MNERTEITTMRDAAIAGWNACMSEVYPILTRKWEDVCTDGIEIVDMTPDTSEELKVVLDRIEARRDKTLQADLAKLKADMDRGLLSHHEVLALCVRPAAAAREPSITWPATKDIVLPRNDAGRTPDPFAFVLSQAAQPWTLQAVVNLLRDSDTVAIPERYEAELAAALHWLLGLVFRGGKNWNELYRVEVDRMREVVAVKKLAVAS